MKGERIISNVSCVSFYKAYFFFTTIGKCPPELHNPTYTRGLQMFSFASSFTWQSFLYTQYMCQKHTLVQSQKSTSVLICSVAELQINSYFRFSLNTVSVWRSELNCYSNIHLKNNDYWYWPYNFKSQVIKTSCRIMLPLANSLHALIILPSCVVSQLQLERTCWRKTET